MRKLIFRNIVVHLSQKLTIYAQALADRLLPPQCRSVTVLE